MDKTTDRRSANFFFRQMQARSNCRKLVILFIVAVFGIIAVLYFAFRLICYINLITNIIKPSAVFEGKSTFLWWDPATFLTVFIAVTSFILIAGMIKMHQLQKGGSSVAQMLGGRLVSQNTSEPAEHQLLNVVEEMAIAAGIPVPLVYILDKEPGINAFAAGLSINDAAVAITQGALAGLNRNELQGVIAHEFSHILNGDMRLNIQLIGIIYSILVIGIIGGEILENHRISSKSAVLFIGGLLLAVIGYIGTFAGRLIQAAVSRQKEFLADASAVRFTRNPGGLANALKKIGGWKTGSLINSATARQASHLFFGETHIDVLFPEYLATHPPLIERILLLDPSFDGVFPAVNEPAKTPPAVNNKPVAFASDKIAGTPVSLPVTAEAGEIVDSVGNPAVDNLNSASIILTSLPGEIKEKLSTPDGAAAVVCALLAGNECRQRESQLNTFQQTVIMNVDKDEFLHLCKLTGGLKEDWKLPVVELAGPSLRGLTMREKRSFSAGIDSLINADGKMTLFEFSLQWVVRQYLAEVNVKISEENSISHITQAGYSILIILRALANAGNREDAAKARQAFNAGMARIPELAGKNHDYFYTGNVNFAEINTALKKLQGASFKVIQVVVDACAHCVFADKTVTVAEAELLRVICLALHCPLPPFPPDKSAGSAC